MFTWIFFSYSSSTRTFDVCTSRSMNAIAWNEMHMHTWKRERQLNRCSPANETDHLDIYYCLHKNIRINFEITLTVIDFYAIVIWHHLPSWKFIMRYVRRSSRSDSDTAIDAITMYARSFAASAALIQSEIMSNQLINGVTCICGSHRRRAERRTTDRPAGRQYESRRVNSIV